MRPGSAATLLAALGSALLLSACAFSQSESEANTFDASDPYHAPLEQVNALYNENPFVQYPTGFGNIALWAAFNPFWGLTAIAEDAARDDGTHPTARYMMASAGYLGGAVVGTPFLALYWGLYKWWWMLFVEKK